MRVRVSKEVDGRRQLVIVPDRRARLPPVLLSYVGRKGYGDALLPAVQAVTDKEVLETPEE